MIKIFYVYALPGIAFGLSTLVHGENNSLLCGDPSLTSDDPCTRGCWNKQAPDGSRICEPVGTGYYSPYGDDDRYECPPGEYSETINAGSCRVCAPGSYSAVWGADWCTYCEEGSFTIYSGATYCDSCDPTFYSGIGSDYADDQYHPGVSYCLEPLYPPDTRSPTLAPATLTVTNAPTNFPTLAPTFSPTANGKPPTSSPTILSPQPTGLTTTTRPLTAAPTTLPTMLRHSLPTQEPTVEEVESKDDTDEKLGSDENDDSGSNNAEKRGLGPKEAMPIVIVAVTLGIVAFVFANERRKRKRRSKESRQKRTNPPPPPPLPDTSSSDPSVDDVESPAFRASFHGSEESNDDESIGSLEDIYLEDEDGDYMDQRMRAMGLEYGVSSASSVCKPTRKAQSNRRIGEGQEEDDDAKSFAFTVWSVPAAPALSMGNIEDDESI